MYIVGLGNPGVEYVFTRHNVGFMVLDLIQREYNVKFQLGNILPALQTKMKIKGIQVSLVKPITYMNRCGQAVKKLDLLRNDEGAITNILVIVDDIHLPLGTIRYREKGSDGGHNGIKSIIGNLGTTLFHRLRIGIGSDKTIGNLHDFVLGNFSEKELENLSFALHDAKDSIEWYLEYGIQTTMNKFNSKVL